jgi:hypothetical protein
MAGVMTTLSRTSCLEKAFSGVNHYYSALHQKLNGFDAVRTWGEAVAARGLNAFATAFA